MMYSVLLAISLAVFPDAMPDALPDAAESVVQATGDWIHGSDGNQYLRDQWGGWWRYETATGCIVSAGRDRPKAMEKTPTPDPAPKGGHWETRRSCGPNGCQQTQVWVPDVEPAVPLPVPPTVEPAQQDAQEPDLWTPRRLLRRW